MILFFSLSGVSCSPGYPELTEDDLPVLSFMQTGEQNQAFLCAGQALSLQSLTSSPVFFSSLVGSFGRRHQTALVVLYGQIIGEQSENKILCPANALGMALLTVCVPKEDVVMRRSCCRLRSSGMTSVREATVCTGCLFPSGQHRFYLKT